MKAATFAEIIRSMIFYLVFYIFSAFLVMWTALLLALGGRGFVTSVVGWSRFHRWCVRNILGIKVVVEGKLPAGRIMVASKHESFFEAIDMPTLLPHPVVFAKAEGEHRGALGRPPGAGRAARPFAESPVERAGVLEAQPPLLAVESGGDAFDDGDLVAGFDGGLLGVGRVEAAAAADVLFAAAGMGQRGQGHPGVGVEVWGGQRLHGAGHLGHAGGVARSMMPAGCAAHRQQLSIIERRARHHLQPAHCRAHPPQHAQGG